MAERHVAPAQPAVSVPAYSVASIPSASTEYVALRDAKGRVYELDKLVNTLGFQVIKAELCVLALSSP